MAGSTPHQLDQIVADLNIHLEMGRDGHSKHFTTFQEMKDFFVKEKEFWSNHTSRAFTPILHLFSHVVVNLQQAEKLETEAEDARSRIDGTVRIVQNGRLKAVISSTPAASALLAASDKGEDVAQGAADYVLNDVNQGRMSSAYFEGLLLAALYVEPDLLDQFLKLDRSVFERSRADMTDLLARLKSEREATAQEVEEWKAQSQTAIEKLLEEKGKSFSTLHEGQTDTFNDFHDDSRNRIRAIEDLYQEKLRLEAPAEYWRGMETDYKKKSRVWIGASCAGTVIVLACLVWILYNPPSALQETKVTVATIKTGLLIAFGISLSTYLITFFVRLATSALHLSRDAAERLQLTHMFLSLVKEKAIEPKDREIVLQALFSRADTGLLKHDGAPTMASPLASVLDALRK